MLPVPVVIPIGVGPAGTVAVDVGELPLCVAATAPPAAPAAITARIAINFPWPPFPPPILAPAGATLNWVTIVRALKPRYDALT